MSTIADLVIKVRTDTGRAEKGLKSLGAGAASMTRASLLPATAALGGLAVVGKAAFDNLQDGARNAKQTESVIRSTGGAANVTAAHVDDLSMSLRRKAGVDDDVIHAGANMLLTFTNVRNEVGRGNNVFDQATRTALDMSHALGQDMNSSAMQLGKALNDPIRGITALQRVGVTFTEGQRDQIKAMVDAGNTMGAQKIILGELNKEFGGSATNIDPTTRAMANLKLNTVDLASSMLVGLMPAISGVVSILGTATAFMARHQTATKILVGALAILASTILAVNVAMKLFASDGVIVTTATRLWTAAQWLLNAALNANPIGLVIIAAAALGAAFVVLWTKSQTFRDIVTGVWNAVKAAAQSVVPVVNSVGSAIRTVFDAIAGVVKAAAAGVRAGVGALVAALQPVLNVLHEIESVAGAALGAIDRVVGAAGKVGGALGAVKGALGHIPGFAGGVRNFAGGLAVVGENGPELVNLPGGSDVYTNAESRGMVGGGVSPLGADDGDLVLVVDGEPFGRIARKYLTRTGQRNVRVAFGA